MSCVTPALFLCIALHRNQTLSCIYIPHTRPEVAYLQATHRL